MLDPKCNVYNGWCPLYINGGDCLICLFYTRTAKQNTIQKCKHRPRMNRLSKAFKRDSKHVADGGEVDELYSAWLKELEIIKNAK